VNYRLDHALARLAAITDKHALGSKQSVATGRATRAVIHARQRPATEHIADLCHN